MRLSLCAVLVFATACSDGSVARPDVSSEREPARAAEDTAEPDEPEPEPRGERDAAREPAEPTEPTAPIDDDAGSAPSDAGEAGDASEDGGNTAQASADAQAEAGAPDANQGGPRYTSDIAPILRQHCTLCHVAGGAGPFSLGDFTEVWQYADEIRNATAAREMPPCEEPAPSCGLSDDQIALIGRWVQAGAPR